MDGQNSQSVTGAKYAGGRYVPSNSNSDLIGQPGSRAQLDTPCLVLDLKQLEANIATGAEMARAAGKQLWPHGKAHKCAEIARRQFEAGAAGLSLATIGEAEIFASKGIRRILLTTIFATDRQIARLVKLVRAGIDLTVVVDHSDTVERLARAFEASELFTNLLIDVDMGGHRSGCPDEGLAVRLAQQVLASPNLRLQGIQAYAGHLSHMTSFEDRRRGAEEASARTGRFLDAVASVSAGRPLRCSGGSTGASALDIEDAYLNELQWGSYPLMDVEYCRVEHAKSPEGLDVPNPFSPALFVATRVINAHIDGVATTDAGDKRFVSKYGTAPEIIRGVAGPAKFQPMSDEHGFLHYQGPRPHVGALLEVMVPHCDPTINLYDDLHVVDGDTLVEIWPIDARGAS